jgi:hypothetical protein
MMVERLKAFNARSKMLPDRILVYRDGVSEVGGYADVRIAKLISSCPQGPIFYCGFRGTSGDEEGFQKI